jgi:hypothetical protein
MGDLAKLNEFVKYARKNAWNTIKENPARLLYGAVDPASTWAWNKVLGRDDKPILNQLGSPQGGGDLGLNKSGGVYADARKDGLSRDEVAQGQTFFGVGDTIAGFYGGSAAAGGLGSAFGNGSSAAGAMGSSASVAPEATGLLATGTESAAAGAGGYSSAAGPSVAAQFAEPAMSVGTAAPTAGGSSSSLINQGQGLLSQSQPQQQQQTQPMYPTQAPDPQAQQAARLRLLQAQQLQALRQKPNKTIEEYQMLQQADKGLLA